MNRIFAFVPLIFAAILAGCGVRYATHAYDQALNQPHEYAREDPDARAWAEEAGDPSKEWRAIRDGYSIEFRSIPREPRWDEKSVLELKVSGMDGAPVTGARLQGKALHVRHTAVRDIVHKHDIRDVRETSPGIYAVPILLDGGGEWTVRYQVTPPGGRTFDVFFSVRVRHAPDPAREWNISKPKAGEK